MQRWRYMGFALVALAVLAMPGHLSAQDVTKKGETPTKVTGPAEEAAKKGETPTKVTAPSPEATQVPAPAAAPAPSRPEVKEPFVWFPFLSDPAYDIREQIALWLVLLVAIAGLVYAGWLVGQVIGADEGTPRMREVGAAIRQGANAYLARQFRAIILLVFILTGLIWATTEGDRAGGRSAGRRRSSWGRRSRGWSASSG